MGTHPIFESDFDCLTDVQMDPKVAWIQPEVFGPAAELWQRLWENSKHDDDSYQTGPSQNPVQSVPPVIEEKLNAQQQMEKEHRLQTELGISKLSPLSPLTSSENAACLIQLDYRATVRNYAQNGKWRQQKYPGGLYGLHLEILDFSNWIKPTNEEYIMRYDVVNRVESVIKHVFPSAQVEIFGSFQTCLYLPTSDIDMVVLNVDLSNLKENPFYKLQNALIEHGVAEALSMKVIDRATVPIVKMRDMLTDIKVDISFNMKTGVESVSLIKEFIREFPALKPLVLLLKQFLLQRDMNEVWTGGISSYGLILMTINFLQMREQQEKLDLGQLLIEFFDLYGHKFNYNKCTIRVKDGGSYIKKEEMQQQMEGRGIPSLLSIEDPLTPSNDIGRSSYGADKVRLAFAYAYRILSRAISPQAAYHTKLTDQGGVLSKLIVVTEQVTSYRQWIADNWRCRVPRLEPIKRPKTLQIERSSIASDGEDEDDSEIVESSSSEHTASVSFSGGETPQLEKQHEKRWRSCEMDKPDAAPTAQQPSRSATTREWDQGKTLTDIWPEQSSQRSGGSKGSGGGVVDGEFRNESYDHDFPVLRDQLAPKKKGSKKSDMSDKESIAESETSVTTDSGRKKQAKPRVNVNATIFNRALAGVGRHDRIVGKEGKRDGKRPTMQHYTPKGRSQTQQQQHQQQQRKSPRTASSAAAAGLDKFL